MDDGSRVARKIGIYSGLFVVFAIVCFAFSVSDPQSPIAIFMSPCFGFWVGGSVFLGVSSFFRLARETRKKNVDKAKECLVTRMPLNDQSRIDSPLVSLIGIAISVLSILAFIAFFLGELIQAGLLE